MTELSTEVVVVGGGPAGFTAAIALAGAGVETALIAKRPSDNRTTALLASSVTALETLGIWHYCREHAAPLRVMRIIDDTGRLLRAPEVHFEASEIGLPAFGDNIENRHLLIAMEQRARQLPSLLLLEDEAEAVDLSAAAATVTLRSGAKISARLAIGAEGRHSLCRAAARIETESRDEPQIAITCNLHHSRPHHDTSTEFHTPTGPFTLVPLPGQRSSLVFVSHPAEGIAALDTQELAQVIRARSHGILGRIELEAERGIFPLRVETARRLGAHRVVLVGEAAHVLPPIGAQGLNLGLRDAATIAELVVPAHRAGGDVGSHELTARYEQMRRADVMGRTLGVDALNRSLLSDFLPVQGARGLGLFLMERIGPLRRAVMREGVMPLASQPRLMRGETL